MKTLSKSIVLLVFAGTCFAQEPPKNQSTLKAKSTLVMVPAFVSSKHGQVIFGLQAKDFLLTDNGKPQNLKLEEDTDSQPLALAVVVETGGLGATHLEHYRELDAILDAFIGNVERQVAVISFDSAPHVSHEASKITSTEPGPAHGCFSHESADSGYESRYNKRVLDCISQLAPPLRLATMSFLLARNGLRTNTAESLAQLTGGRFSHFHNAEDLKAGLIALSNDIPNYYVLSFVPSNPTPGLHALELAVKDRPQAVAKSRREYWIDDTQP